MWDYVSLCEFSLGVCLCDLSISLDLKFLRFTLFVWICKQKWTSWGKSWPELGSLYTISKGAYLISSIREAVLTMMSEWSIRLQTVDPSGSLMF